MRSLIKIHRTFTLIRNASIHRTHTEGLRLAVREIFNFASAPLHSLEAILRQLGDVRVGVKPGLILLHDIGCNSSTASRLLMAGVDLKTVQELMGRNDRHDGPLCAPHPATPAAKKLTRIKTVDVNKLFTL